MRYWILLFIGCILFSVIVIMASTGIGMAQPPVGYRDGGIFHQYEQFYEGREGPDDQFYVAFFFRGNSNTGFMYFRTTSPENPNVPGYGWATKGSLKRFFTIPFPTYTLKIEPIGENIIQVWIKP